MYRGVVVSSGFNQVHACAGSDQENDSEYRRLLMEFNIKQTELRDLYIEYNNPYNTTFGPGIICERFNCRKEQLRGLEVKLEEKRAKIENKDKE